MAHYRKEWEDIGRSVRQIVDQAVNSQDYQKLNQTIRQTVEKAVDLGTDVVRKAATQEKPQFPERQELSDLYGNTGRFTTQGFLKIAGGAVLTGSTLVFLLAALALSFTGGGGVPLLLSAAALAGGVGLIGSGVGSLNMVTRFKSYKKTLGQKTYCSLEKLARSVNRGIPYVKKELKKMIENGLLPEGHLDREETMLITSHATYRYFEQSRLQLEARREQEARLAAQKESVPHTPQVREVLEKGDAFLEQIRACNDAIPGAEISRKISRMEHIVERIFRRVDSNPEVVPDLKKMMDYYLPMTVKLLRAYADMDAQSVQGENIQNAKKEIEQTLDTLNFAFEKLLDELFEDTVLDVSSDISVLQTLLAQEGLTEDGLTNIKKNL